MALDAKLLAVVQSIGADIKALLGRALPAGGLAGQVLSKNTGTDYDAGWITPSGAGSDPWTRLKLTSDFTNATVAFTDVTGLAVTIPANTNFMIELDLLVAAVATANLPRIGFNWNAALAYGGAEIWVHSSGTAKAFLNGLNLTAAGNLQMAAGTAAVAGTYAGGGFFKGRTGAAAVTIKLQLAAETAAANAAILKNGSELRYRAL